MQIPHIVAISDPALSALLQADIDHKTKPPGSLGRLEALARQIGLIQQTRQPQLRQPAIIVFAGDHGIVAEKVSAYPQSVTWQMVENFLAQGAAINVFARQHGLALHIVDAGVNHVFGPRSGLIDKKIAPGTANFAEQAAMSERQCQAAMAQGSALVTSLIASAGGNVLGFGEMGIGNSSAAAAIMQRLTGVPLAHCVGSGAGLDAAGVLHKQQVLARALALHAGAQAPLAVLATFGGFEMAMMVGAMLAAARQRMLLLIDGFIVTSALLVAARLQPAILDYCVFSHCSQEQGHQHLLAELKAQPLLQLDLRLGEGSGCALAWPLVQAAVNFLGQMATFDSAGVSAKTGAAPTKVARD